MIHRKKLIKIHVILGVICSLPIVLTIITGIFLILRSYLPFMQPATINESPVNHSRLVSPGEILNKNDIVGEISSIIYKPKNGIVQIRTNDHYEYLISARTHKIIGHGPKRTSLFIQLHEGSFFGKNVRDYLFLPSSVFLLITILTGLFLSLSWFKRMGLLNFMIVRSSKVYDEQR